MSWRLQARLQARKHLPTRRPHAVQRVTLRISAVVSSIIISQTLGQFRRRYGARGAAPVCDGTQLHGSHRGHEGERRNEGSIVESCRQATPTTNTVTASEQSADGCATANECTNEIAAIYRRSHCCSVDSFISHAQHHISALTPVPSFCPSPVRPHVSHVLERQPYARRDIAICESGWAAARCCQDAVSSVCLRRGTATRCFHDSRARLQGHPPSAD